MRRLIIITMKINWDQNFRWSIQEVITRNLKCERSLSFEAGFPYKGVPFFIINMKWGHYHIYGPLTCNKLLFLKKSKKHICVFEKYTPPLQRLIVITMNINRNQNLRWSIQEVITRNLKCERSLSFEAGFLYKGVPAFLFRSHSLPNYVVELRMNPNYLYFWGCS